MSDTYFAGVNVPYPDASTGVIVEDCLGVTLAWKVNRYPLTVNLAREAVGSPSFFLTTENYRPRTDIISNSGTAITSSQTTLPFVDASFFDVGDVIEAIGTGGLYEQMLITAMDVPGTPDTVTVVRGYAGSTAATIPDGTSVFLIGNTRTGGEINQNAINRLPTVTEQYQQVCMHSYQTSGMLQGSTNYVSAYGTPVMRDRWWCMQAVADDMESAMYYGRGVKLSAGQPAPTRPMQYGIRSLLKTNVTTNPTNAAAYRPYDFVRDVTQGPLNNGGKIDFVLVSTSFQLALAEWSLSQYFSHQGETAFGVPIESLQLPFLPNVTIALAPLLKQGDVFGLTKEEATIAMGRPMFDKPRGSRGDAVEGDIIMQGAIAIKNEYHHSYTTGITGYAKQT
jgi:Family of unknown function (DUF5309)